MEGEGNIYTCRTEGMPRGMKFMRTFLTIFSILASLLLIAAEGVAIPLPEHPRPDWARDDWMNLNGEWEFGFAPDVLGRTIVVPFGWGSPASGVDDGGDTGYYRRKVRVPQSWKGKRIFVVVGASDHDTECTFGGEKLGGYSGGYVPFEFELTDFVKWGEDQLLEFKVWDPSPEAARNGGFLYGKQGYGNVRGIWQTVYLEARGKEYLDSVRFTPDLKCSVVDVLVRFGAPAKSDGLLTIRIDGDQHCFAVKRGDCSVSGKVKLDSPHLWNLEDPYLYDVALIYDDDIVRSYFGFREIGIGRTPAGEDYVSLNGKPIYLQMCLDQSYHPDGWYTFPTDASMKKDIMISKALALSGNRVHIKVEVPRKLYWADKMGLLIQADVPCAWGDAGEGMFEEHWKCFEAMVKRDFNHPSIYQWTLFNETWGLFSNRSLKMGLASGNGGGIRTYRDSTQRRVAEAYMKAKALDPTRIVEDNSPCNNDHVITDVNTWHRYHAGYEWESCLDAVCSNTFNGSAYNFTGGNRQGCQPMMNSECGNVWGYEGSTGDCDFTWDYHLMINAFRRHHKCSGWLYTEHHDVCNEWNGYVRFDRTPKETGFEELAGMSLADLHRDAAIYFAGNKGWETGELLPPGVEISIPVGVSLVTDKYSGKKLEMTATCWYVDDGGLRTEHQVPDRWSGTAKSWQCEGVWSLAFKAPPRPSCGAVVFALAAEGEVIARNFWSFGVTNTAPTMVTAAKSEWSGGSTNVLNGLKLNGFGSGYFEFQLDAPDAGGIFIAELSSKRKNAKDFSFQEQESGLDYMLGGGTALRSKSPNSYPQTSFEKFAATLSVYVNDELFCTQVLPDDPADHRGILSWLSQPHDGRLREAGSYGYPVRVEISAAAVRGGQVKVRLQSDNGLAVYGPRFGRFPYGPSVK